LCADLSKGLVAFNARGGAIRFIMRSVLFSVGRAGFFARHEAFNVALFGVQNSVHTLVSLQTNDILPS